MRRIPLPSTAPRSESAFTLFEVLVATVIIGLVVVGVVSTYTTAFVADRSSQEIVAGRDLAQEVMESMAAVDFEALPTMDGATVDRGDLTATVAVTQVSTGLLRVQVVVTHASIGEVNIPLVTLVADRG